AAMCVVVAGVAFSSVPVIKDRDLRRALAVGGTVGLILLAFVGTPALNLADLSIGAYDSLVRVLAKTRDGAKDSDDSHSGSETHELLLYDEGPTATVSVRRDWGITSMAINGRTNASDSVGDMPTQV